MQQKIPKTISKMCRLYARYGMYGLDMSPDLHWVSGGGEANTPVGPVPRSEAYDGEGGFRDGVEFPPLVRGHCVARLDRDRAIVVLGEDGGKHS